MLAHDGKALTMDADRFDSLSRSLPFRSRRGAVRAISILGALGVLDRLGATAAEKKKGGKKKGGRSKRDCESWPDLRVVPDLRALFHLASTDLRRRLSGRVFLLSRARWGCPILRLKWVRRWALR
jgi:hypothetical protein